MTHVGLHYASGIVTLNAKLVKIIEIPNEMVMQGMKSSKNLLNSQIIWTYKPIAGSPQPLHDEPGCRQCPFFE